MIRSSLRQRYRFDEAGRLPFARLVGLQVLLGLAVLGLFVLWLRVPDASVVDVLATVILGSLLLLLACGGEAALLLRLCERPRTRSAWLRGAALLLLAALVWFGGHLGLAALEDKLPLYAGYLNSRFPAALRPTFSYRHLLLWLGWGLALLDAVLAGLLLLLATAFFAAVRPGDFIGRGLRSPRWWATLLLATFAALWLTAHLTGWVPGHSLGAELLGLVLRLGAVMVLDGLCLAAVLSVLASLVRQSHTAYSTPAGTVPDRSQPRTDAMP